MPVIRTFWPSDRLTVGSGPQTLVITGGGVNVPSERVAEVRAAAAQANVTLVDGAGGSAGLPSLDQRIAALEALFVGAGGGIDAELIRDTIANALQAGTNVQIAHDDAANTITVSALGGSSYTAENARDDIAAALRAGAGITVTADDAGDTITIASTGLANVNTSGAAVGKVVAVTGMPSGVPQHGYTDAGIAQAAADARYAALGQGGVTKFGRQRSTVVTNFESGHGWTIQAAGGGTSDLNDTTDVLFGSQAVRLTTAGAGASVILTKSGLPALPTNRMYRLWVKAAEPERLAQVRLLLASDAGFTNYYTLAVPFSSSSIPESQRPLKAGEWIPVAFPRSLMVATGSPDPNALTYARILVNDRNAGALAATVRLNRLETVPYPGGVYSGGLVSFTYDDTFASHFSVARAHLDKYGYAGTLFPILDRIGQGGYLTNAQIDELVQQHGWEVGAHATTLAKHQQGFPAMSSAERTAEFTALRAWQQARGYDSPCLAYPSGLCDVATGVDARPFYSVGRLALGRFSASGPDDTQNPALPLRLYSQNPTNLTLAQMTAEVDRAVANNTWLNFTFHDLVTTKAATNDVTIADHLALVDYCATVGATVRTMSEVVRAQTAAA